jgi:hypothetical protein
VNASDLAWVRISCFRFSMRISRNPGVQGFICSRQSPNESSSAADRRSHYSLSAHPRSGRQWPECAIRRLSPSHRWPPRSALRRRNHARRKAATPSPNTPAIATLARHLLLWWGLNTQARVARNGAYILRMGHGRRRGPPYACSRARDRGRSELCDRCRRRCVERRNRLPVAVL